MLVEFGGRAPVSWTLPDPMGPEDVLEFGEHAFCTFG